MLNFGIEYEFDFIDRDGHIFTFLENSHYRHLSNWGHQHDTTAGCELSTPVYTDIVEAFQSHKEQFNYFIRGYSDVVPYMCNRNDRSLGAHIHIGAPNRRLNTQEAIKIATAIAPFYPLLASLQAQPIPSNRGLFSNYCYSISRINFNIPYSDHYCEISNSHLGTVEFRLFDSNIPQIALTNAFIMLQLAKKAINSSHRELPVLDRRNYDNFRRLGLRHGPIALDILSYLQKLKEFLGNIQLPPINSVKEILFLASKYFMNAYQLKVTFDINSYKYFRENLLNPLEFFENIKNLVSGNNKRRIEIWMDEVRSINTLEDLISLIEISRRGLLTSYMSRDKVIQLYNHRYNNEISRSYVRERIEIGQYYISRISSVSGLNQDEVAKRIYELLRYEGENYVNILSPSEIINAPQRFYVFWVLSNDNTRAYICGTVAVNINTGEISSLVVSRRFRGLGIARLLLNRVLSLNRNYFYTYVRKDNERALNLFKNLGFRLVSENERSYCLELRR